ncbi:MAG: CidA/LrgA family protein [Salaquimonas sp.]
MRPDPRVRTQFGGRSLLNYLTLIFGCQLAGEFFAKTTGLPLPGPVFGMVLLIIFLFSRKLIFKSNENSDVSGVPLELAKVGDVLLGNLSLLFVPAGVGVMVHFALLKEDWIALSAAILGSTILTIAVTASLMVFLSRRKSIPNEIDGKKG